MFSFLYLVFYLQRTLTTKWLKTNWFKSQYLYIGQWLVNFPTERISRAEKIFFKTCVCISLVGLFSQCICLLICGPALDNNRVLTLNRTFLADQCSMIVTPWLWMRVALKVIFSILFCWPTMTEVDVGGTFLRITHLPFVLIQTTVTIKWKKKGVLGHC